MFKFDVLTVSVQQLYAFKQRRARHGGAAEQIGLHGPGYSGQAHVVTDGRRTPNRCDAFRLTSTV